MTSDGHLVVEHDSTLTASTNILEYEKEFQDRQRDNGSFYVNDFTLAELRLLKRKMREDYRSPLSNDKYNIISLEEAIEWTLMLAKDYPRKFNNGSDHPVGLYIELKDYASTFAYLGLDMAEKMN